MTIKIVKLYLAGAFFAAILGAAPATAAPEFEAPAKEAEFISSLSREMLSVLRSPVTSSGERNSTFEVILRRNFDLAAIGRMALGRYWRYASAEQKAEYLELFPGHLVQSYSGLLAGYTDERLEVGRAENLGGNITIVHSKVLRASGPAIQVIWRVHHSQGVLKVVDVVVEGMSMAITKRAEFSSVARKRGVGGVLRKLRAMSLRNQPPAGARLAAVKAP